MRRPLPLLMLACLGLAAADAAWAQRGQPRSPPFQPQPRQETPSPLSAPRPEFPRPSRRDDSSLSDFVRQAQRANGGRVLGAERVQADGQEFTRLKIMDKQGRVRYVDENHQPRGADRRRAPPSRDADATTP